MLSNERNVTQMGMLPFTKDLEEMTDLYSKHYQDIVNLNIRQSAQDPEGARTAMAAIQDWEAEIIFDQKLYTKLGIPEFAGHLNTGKTLDFRKEDIAQDADIVNYQIWEDASREEWLLKRITLSSEVVDYRVGHKILDLQKIKHSQLSQVASTIADQVGYPVPETILVQQGGHLYLASKYLEGAVDNASAKQVASVQNYGARDARAFFNVLIGAAHDASHQKLIHDGRYYAMDLDMFCEGDSAFPHVTSSDVLEHLRDGDYGNIDLSNPVTLEAGKQLIGRARENLTTAVLDAIFEKYIGTAREKDMMVKSVRNRITILEKVIAQFEKDPKSL